MSYTPQVATRQTASVLDTNKVLRNTYLLLSMTLIFSAVTAAVSMALQPGPLAYWISLGGSFLLLWLVLPRVAHSAAGLGVVFAITGLLGFGLGPILNMYLGLANGGLLVMQALGATGVVFVGLSAYAVTTRKDFSFMGGFLMAGLILVIVAGLANLFLQIPALALAISTIAALIMSALILFDTSRIVNGGETNYIMATIGLYLSIYNLFLSLLHLLGVFGGGEE